MVFALCQFWGFLYFLNFLQFSIFCELFQFQILFLMNSYFGNFFQKFQKNHPKWQSAKSLTFSNENLMKFYEIPSFSHFSLISALFAYFRTFRKFSVFSYFQHFLLILAHFALFRSFSLISAPLRKCCSSQRNIDDFGGHFRLFAEMSTFCPKRRKMLKFSYFHENSEISAFSSFLGQKCSFGTKRRKRPPEPSIFVGLQQHFRKGAEMSEKKRKNGKRAQKCKKCENTQKVWNERKVWKWAKSAEMSEKCKNYGISWNSINISLENVRFPALCDFRWFSCIFSEFFAGFHISCTFPNFNYFLMN